MAFIAFWNHTLHFMPVRWIFDTEEQKRLDQFNMNLNYKSKPPLKLFWMGLSEVVFIKTAWESNYSVVNIHIIIQCKDYETYLHSGGMLDF